MGERERDDNNADKDDDDAEDANVAWVEGVANIIIPRRGADTNRVEAAATRPGAIDISQKRPAVAPSISSEILLQYILTNSVSSFWRGNC